MPVHTSRGSAAAQRHKVAREAANLLYSGLEKEYRQAKLKAAERLGARSLPSNLEIALEMDLIAEAPEGSARNVQLIQMRTEARDIMRQLMPCCPLLIGSVWRGTVRRTSDIDIEVYSDEAEALAASFEVGVTHVARTEWVTKVEHGAPETTLHVYAKSHGGFPVEIVVRGAEKKGAKRTCDTFGDIIEGLTLHQLERLLKENPAERFLPPIK